MYQVASLRSRMVALAAVLATIIFCAPQAGFAAENYNGLPHFGRVTDQLFRGAQPKGEGYAALRDMGVAIVVNFRDESSKIAAERSQVEALGMKFVSIPWRGRDYPRNEQVAEFLNLVRANPNSKIFVHCKAGKDRTGVMVAAYRIAVERKSVADAVEEMHDYKYHNFSLPHLKRYVKTIPEQLESDKVFSAYSVNAPALAAPSTPTVMAADAPEAEPVAAPAAAPAAEPAAIPASVPAVLTPAVRPAAAQ